MVEHRLTKAKGAGSNPPSRSKYKRLRLLGIKPPAINQTLSVFRYVHVCPNGSLQS